MKTKNKPLTEQEKQITPMNGEIEPKNAKTQAFISLEKARQRLKIKSA